MHTLYGSAFLDTERKCFYNHSPSTLKCEVWNLVLIHLHAEERQTLCSHIWWENTLARTLTSRSAMQSAVLYTSFQQYLQSNFFYFNPFGHIYHILNSTETLTLLLSPKKRSFVLQMRTAPVIPLCALRGSQRVRVTQQIQHNSHNSHSVGDKWRQSSPQRTITFLFTMIYGTYKGFNPENLF